MKLRISNFNREDLPKIKNLPVSSHMVEDTLLLEVDVNKVDIPTLIKYLNDNFQVEYKNINEIV
jgi:hypothetical protein